MLGFIWKVLFLPGGFLVVFLDYDGITKFFIVVLLTAMPKP